MFNGDYVTMSIQMTKKEFLKKHEKSLFQPAGIDVDKLTEKEVALIFQHLYLCFKYTGYKEPGGWWWHIMYTVTGIIAYIQVNILKVGGWRYLK